MYIFLVISFLILRISEPSVYPQSIDNGCWPFNIVSFDLDPALEEHQILLIEDRMKHVSDWSCLRFVNINEVYLQHHMEPPKKYLHFRPTSDEYCRLVEEQKNGSVVLTIELGTGCTTDRGILHEIVHSLGFKHEHQRVDRKCYVKVFWSKVTQVEAFAVDFNYPDNDWLERFPYDKLSIMHYRRTSKLKARSERWFEWEPMGNTDGRLTWFDIWKINYKHCSVQHYCDIYPQHCDIMESSEKDMDCKRNQ